MKNNVIFLNSKVITRTCLGVRFGYARLIPALQQKKSDAGFEATSLRTTSPVFVHCDKKKKQQKTNYTDRTVLVD